MISISFYFLSPLFLRIPYDSCFLSSSLLVFLFWFKRIASIGELGALGHFRCCCFLLLTEFHQWKQKEKQIITLQNADKFQFKQAYTICVRCSAFGVHSTIIKWVGFWNLICSLFRSNASYLQYHVAMNHDEFPRFNFWKDADSIWKISQI